MSQKTKKVTVVFYSDWPTVDINSALEDSLMALIKVTDTTKVNWTIKPKK